MLDCHSAAAVVLAAEVRGLTPGGPMPFVTAGIEVRYRRPAPLQDAVELLSRVVAIDDNDLTVEAELWWQDKIRATAASTWKRWRPRDRESAVPQSH